MLSVIQYVMSQRYNFVTINHLVKLEKLKKIEKIEMDTSDVQNDVTAHEADLDQPAGFTPDNYDERPPMVQFVDRLFEKGLETWDRENEVAVNVGGGKFWMRIRHGDPSVSGLIFHDQNLRDAITNGVRGTCYLVDRVVLDDEGKIVYQEKNGVATEWPRRFCQALAFYSATDANPKSGEILKAHILAKCPELEGYVSVLSEHTELLVQRGVAKIHNGVAVIPGIPVRDPQLNVYRPARASAMVLIGVSPGAAGTGSYWGFGSTKANAQGAASPESATPPV